jgi:hypothetical protein
MVHVIHTGFKSEKVLFGFLDYHIFFRGTDNAHDGVYHSYIPRCVVVKELQHVYLNIYDHV